MLNKVPLGTSSNEMRCTFAYVEVLGLGARVFQPGDPVPKDAKRMRRRRGGGDMKPQQREQLSF